MQRKTHLLFGIIFFLMLNYIFKLPILYGIFALIGAVFPDFDLKFMHRKILHNVWAMILAVFIGMSINLMDTKIALIFSLGFLSHLISDSLTPTGIMPFWPIEKPKFKWNITTGSFGELILTGVLIIILAWFVKFVIL